VTPGASLSPKNVFLRFSEKFDLLKLGDASGIVASTEDAVEVGSELVVRAVCVVMVIASLSSVGLWEKA
jgi:hypothetical protein